MTALDKALSDLVTQTEALPFEGGVSTLYDAFRSLAKSNFLIPGKRFLTAFELAAIAKWVYLNGNDRRNAQFDWPSVLNAYKNLWKQTEAESDYPDDPAVLACFILRFAYQQLPWHLTPQRMERNYQRTIGLFGASSASASGLRAAFEHSAGISLERFLDIAKAMYGIFVGTYCVPSFSLTERLLECGTRSEVSSSLNLLTATRRKFRKYYENRVAAAIPSGVVYEFNPLLRYPVMLRGDHYWCVYPELINYSATRGLYFLISDAAGASFSRAFAPAFEEYVRDICASAFGGSRVISEAMEREMGWDGKTNDVTLILGNIAILFECKNSGLFSLSKKSADPRDLIADIRQNLANAKKRKGLFQLFDKIQAIRSGQMPGQLKELYSTVDEFFPIVLLYDEVWFANRPETLKNLIDSELRENGVEGFGYQVWQVEELEVMLRAVPLNEIPGLVKEKFSVPSLRTLDLSVHLSSRCGLKDLSLHLFTPNGASRAWQILSALADKDNESPSP